LTPRICVSILPKTAPEAVKLIDRAEGAGADLIEVRLDLLKNTEALTDIAGHGKTPKIATVKLANSGGKFAGTEIEQKRFLLTAAKSGFQYVDVDLSAVNLKEFTTEASTRGAKCIVSFHDFNEALELTELNSILDREIACDADVCKIVTTARRIDDNLTLLNFTSAASRKAKVVCFGMDDAGRVSRLLSPLFGGFFTFAALKSGAETASGQMTIKEMRTAYRLLGF
jgi:3-dehydroquinate dehydratase type I